MLLCIMKTQTKKRIAALCALLCAGFVMVVSAYAESKIESSSVKREDGSDITYYLEFANPSGSSEFLLLALQGSDANSVRNIAAIGRVRKVWPDADLVTVEKYGITDALPYSAASERPDCPKSYLLHDNPDQRASDAIRVLTLLRDTHGYRKIAVIGGSEGSVVAGLLASRTGFIDAGILFGGGGRWFRDDVIQTMKSSPMSPEDLRKNVEGFTRFADYVVASKEPFDLAMGDHGYSWWKSMLTLDQLGVISSVSVPVLIAQGGLDTSASPDAAKEMASALKAAGKANVSFFFYPDKNHSLGFSDGDGSSDKPLADMRLWLQDALKK